MKYSISEAATLMGVSVRTLHYYDEIGLLLPSSVVPETGYRYYDEKALEKLQQILFYKELDFSIKDIVKIMDSPDYQKEEAMQNQRELLKMKKERLERLIGLLDAGLKGENTMSIKEFDMTEIENAKEKYAKEVQEKWGSTDAYMQSQKKTAGFTKEDWAKSQEKASQIMQEFAKHIGENPASVGVQKLVEVWQSYITEFYYDCTKEILAGLGQMYVADERFMNNMDQHGAGTAKLMSEAIAIYCA